ncbi:hypothetical protein ACFWJS_33665 [Streptomyces sp. NPDC127061]|uniref:hypothetical protein n=1 Tax=Streptomyces sp. NPDC127061 TaxID=3347122 RepID=UPI00365D8193
MDKHLVQFVTTEADRNTRLAGAPDGTVAVSTTTGSVWARAAGVWVTWWEPTPAWRTLSLASTYMSQDPTPQIRRVGKQVSIRGRATRVDGGLIDARNGVKIADVPADCVPAVLASGAGSLSLAGDPIVGLCRTEVLATGMTSSVGGAGSVLVYTQDGVVTSGGATWVGVEISYWLD